MSKRRNLKFSRILAVGFFVLTLLVSVEGVFYIYTSSREILLEHVKNHLETAVKSTANHVETFIEWKKARAVDFSSDGFIRSSLIDLNKGISPVQTTNKLNDHLIANKLPVDKDIYEVFILDENGEIVGTTNSERDLGDDFSEDPIFLKAKSGPYATDIFYDVEFKTKSIALSAPILDEENLSGVVVIKIFPESLAEITTKKIGLGETGDLYIVNREKYLLTPSIFLRGENKGVFTQTVDTQNSRKCLSDLQEFFSESKSHDHQDDSVEFVDYRGISVIGAYEIIHEMNWCLLAEIDKSEAVDAPLMKVVKKDILIFSIVIFVLTLTGFFLGKFLDKRYVLRAKERKH